MRNFNKFIAFSLFPLAGCTPISLQPLAGPLSEQEPIPVIDGSARSLQPASGRLRFRMPDGRLCSSAWSAENRSINCNEGTAVAVGLWADSRPTVIGIAKDNDNNILALRTRYLVQPRIVQFCMDESIAYASAMARCLDEGKSEDQCDRENAESASAEVACWLREMKSYRKWIVGLLRLPLPPRPGPIPPVD